MEPQPDFVWNSPRAQYPADFLAWFEGWRGPMSDYTDTTDEADEDDEDVCNYLEARFLAFGGWNAGQASVLSEQPK